MKLETQLIEDHQAKLKVEIEDERLEAMKRRAAAKLARRVKIPGFRPGKAPYPVILRNVGEAAVFEEALELLVDEVYPEAIKEAEIKPYGPGKLENLTQMEPLTLEFVVPLDAEVKLGDYKAMRKPYEPEPVSDEKVAEAIESLRSRQAILEPVERTTGEGDVVTVSISGNIQDGENQTSVVKDQSVPLLVKEDTDWPFPGFALNLIGKSTGDEGQTEYTYPEDYRQETLRGKTVQFHYKISDIKSRTLPELNDEFAQSIGDFDTFEKLTGNVRSMLEKQAEDAYNEAYDEEIISEAIEQTDYKYTPQMLDDEIHQVMHDMENRLKQQGLDIDIYLKSRGLDHEAWHEEVRPLAEKRLKRSLLLFELARAENIEVESEELESETGNTLNYLQQVLPKQEARRLSNRDIHNNVINNVLVDLLTRKTIERFRKIASGQAVEQEVVSEKSIEELNNKIPSPESEPDASPRLTEIESIKGDEENIEIASSAEDTGD